ncbi:SCP2 sterol-binding domain-containing protein [Roseovarius sp. Pro17]|uniref:SCP2 sterol-binding domain-containing protein n=1 Tax=Roseovarius sp. Pro17 TaxID=3108175 RepID=UPI002D78B10E|nr:SCP2 sterol-binding domain-containing protein [Roseovarius sp. Pro17]
MSDTASDVVNEAVEALNARMNGDAMEGSAKFVIANEGAVFIDAKGARACDDPADVTLSADADTFRAIVEGDLDPAAAFMTGKLDVEGDMGVAMQLGRVLS